MEPFILYQNQAADIILETTAISGISYIAGIFCEDIRRVCGVGPKTVQEPQAGSTYAILVATCGHSGLLDFFEQKGLLDLSDVRGKREVYGIFRVKQPIGDTTTEFLVIAGSDKRGTIYGMFHISEKIGVSPWVFWADAVPKHREEIIFTEEICTVSKEPSVRYRGFFINDEQPCFGNWAKEKYGSVRPGPELYRHIFELLLRLKGNYLWPAMWRSDFTLDHLENARLADTMGVIIGASHHEPCCRSGGEFQKLRHENKAYGKEWSFLSNAAGISEFWKDGLLRNREFESLITIGMRGENDSYLMPEDATLADNINVLKAAITEQKKLIAAYGNQAHPQLLAIYKEVEDYYYGDENTPGLKDWEVLKDDILMLCDDNFGNVRTLPGAEAKDHPGGYGMYYHFDYYGGPVSYLWINSVPLTKIWEQMCMAYDFGVRGAWIVNVGDIKNQELPLSYFLDLAYDFDAWGTKNPNRTVEYTKEWLRGLGFDEVCAGEGAGLIGTYTKWNGTCRPEVLSAKTYHPCNFHEAWRMYCETYEAQLKLDELWGKQDDEALRDCFFEVVGYPVEASANILRMQLSAGFNQYYASQGVKRSSEYERMIECCIRKDRELSRLYHSRLDGKWNHMQSVFHIGYRGWNDEEWQYPRYAGFYPVSEPRLLVGVVGQEGFTGGNPWRRRTLHVALAAKVQPKFVFEVANGGRGTLKYRIEWDADWLEVAWMFGGAQQVTNPQRSCELSRQFKSIDSSARHMTGLETTGEENFIVRLKPGHLPEGEENCSALIRIYGENCEETAERSENGYSETRVDIQVQVDSCGLYDVEAGTFVEWGGILSVEAPHFCDSTAAVAGKASYKVIEDYGKTWGGIKVFPVTEAFTEPETAPRVAYKLYVAKAGEYRLTLYSAPSNPVVYQGKMRVAVKANDGKFQVVNTIPDEGYVPWQSPAWSRGVLEQIHRTECRVLLKEGNNLLYLAALDPAVVLEKLVLVREGVDCPASYLGAPESFCME